MCRRIPAVLVAAVGIAAAGLLSTPIATAQAPGQCPEDQFPTADGTGCAGIPDPTKYGCPAGDFQCMFDTMAPPR